MVRMIISIIEIESAVNCVLWRIQNVDSPLRLAVYSDRRMQDNPSSLVLCIQCYC